MAAALYFGVRADDLFHLDLAYAPPYSLAKDILHYVGMSLVRALDKE